MKSQAQINSRIRALEGEKEQAESFKMYVPTETNAIEIRTLKWVLKDE